MVRSVHVIDFQTPRDMLRQLSLLAGPEEQVICIGKPPQYLSPPLAPRQVRPPFGVGALGGWRLKLAPPHPQAVHAWSMSAHAATSQIAYDLRCPLVLSLPCLPPGQLGGLLAMLPHASERANLILTLPTEAARAALIATAAGGDKKPLTGPLQANQAIHVLPPAAAKIVDAADRRPRVRSALGLREDEILMVSPEDMVRGAGHKYAIWSHAILRNVVPNVRLLLPGHGPYEPSIRYFAGTTGYDSEIYFTGDDLDLADTLSAADVAAFLGERDTSTTALAATMAAGLPIVASRTPGAESLLREGVSALLVPLRDPRRSTAALLKLYDQADLRRRLGASASACLDAAPAHIRETLEGIYLQAAHFADAPSP